MNISIITPVLNEEQHIARFLDDLSERRNMAIKEHILVDGGSTDQTLHHIANSPVTLISSTPGRGNQQNAGAEIASGDILLFLHCDTRLPLDFAVSIQQVLSQPKAVAGAFCLTIDHPHWLYRLIERGANLRSRLFQLPYGDQAIFVKKNIFDEIGGLPNQPILEEIPFLRQLRQLGRIPIASSAVVTSARRWQRLGIFQTTVINQIMLAGMLIGISPQRLAKLYVRGSDST